MKIEFSENQKMACIESLRLINRLGHHDLDYVFNKIEDLVGFTDQSSEEIKKYLTPSKNSLSSIDIKMASRYAMMKVVEKKIDTSEGEIELSDNEVDCLWKANEIMHRLTIGQFWSLSEELSMYQFHDYLYPKHESEADVTDIKNAKREFEDLMNKLSDKVTVINHHENLLSAYTHDNWQTLRGHMAWKREPKGGMGVSFDSVLKRGDDQLPKITDPEAPPRQKRSFRM